MRFELKVIKLQNYLWYFRVFNDANCDYISSPQLELLEPSSRNPIGHENFICNSKMKFILKILFYLVPKNKTKSTIEFCQLPFKKNISSLGSPSISNGHCISSHCGKNLSDHCPIKKLENRVFN
jgi:hypothetical protein